MAWRVVLVVAVLFFRLGWNVLWTSAVRTGQVVSVDHFADFRRKVTLLVTRRLPEPEAGLVLGVTLGQKSSLTESFYRKLVNSGTVHMVVASGYNVMVVAYLALSVLLVVFRRGFATFLAIMVMFAYALLAGLEVSIVRASLMGGMLLLASVFGRRTASWWTLFLVAASMVIVEPLLLENISFQLSVAATAGVIIVGPFVTRKLSEEKIFLLPAITRLDLVSTLAAIVMTAPIIWYHFGRGSPVSPISNTIILPLVPLLMAFGGLLIAVGLFLPSLADFFALPAYALAHLISSLVNFFG